MSRAVAALGDSALLLPASALLVLYLLALRQSVVALAFAVVLGCVGAATVALKIAFHACGHAVVDFDVVSPSGHVSFATVFYGALACLLGARRQRLARAGLWGAAAAIVLLVGASRVRTHAHTVEEVLIGFGIGALGLALFVLAHRRLGRPAVPPWPLAAGFALALLLLGGSHFSLESKIASAARRLSATLDVCAEVRRP